MRRPKHNLRVLMLLWKHLFTGWSVAILIGVILVLYLSTRDINRIDNTSSVTFPKRLIKLFEIDQRTNNLHRMRRNVSSRISLKKEYLKDLNGFQKRNNISVNRHTASHEQQRANQKSYQQDSALFHSGVKKENVGYPDGNINSQGKKQRDVPHQNQLQGVQRQDIAHHNQLQGVQRKDIALPIRDDQNDPRKENANFSPDEYLSNVNMTEIVRQFDIKGYADEQTINAFDHRFIINPEKTCNFSDNIKVLFIVKSSPDHISRRVTIRETWANRKRFPSTRTIFSFGLPKSSKSFLQLQDESSTYNDILLVNYVDDYYNLTLKTVSGLKWTVAYCARAMYVISVDDDLYVATDLLLSYLNIAQVRRVDNLFSGHLIVNTNPIRIDRSKWRVSKSEYPFKNYPEYIFGGFVIMSMSTVRKFTVAALYTKIFKFEDVYLGILAAKLGIEATNNGYVNSRKTFTSSESFKTLIASHFYYDPNDLQRAWDCHLSILDQDDDKAIFCDYIGDRLRKLQTEINSIVGWLQVLKQQA
ncbi:beta-1,3-galactosyltransferase 5-like [Mizuhopecten yessoensis]|uniref:Beta-1,3-galactosyltransferase brn n=1 Tax=Mizuhopecten yessoensis TaxID=6573 RepID=A0A210QB63_MIZYE|nr:beta-1,3-galactosyltransferase 5-like [Mizuhopecten yessoensis]OWF45975.1 Beta-1,3-galactosyltransferase brn [Mizuhopecten yessoensis]